MKRTIFLTVACLFALLIDVGRGDEVGARKLVAEADQLARDKKFEDALKAIRQAIKEEPKNDRYLMIASEINRRAGRFEDGKRDALAALQINDKVGMYYMLVAANAYSNEEPELALEYCRKVLDMGASKAGDSAYKNAKLYEDLLVNRTYTITWNLDPSNPKQRKFIRDYLPIAAPKTGLPYQSVEVQVKGAKLSRLIKGDANDVVNVVPDGNKKFQVITKVTLTPMSYKAKLAKAAQSRNSGTLPAHVRPYLAPAQTFDPNSRTLQKVAEEVKGGTSVQTVRNIAAWLKKNIKYKEGPKDLTKLNFENVNEIVERGHAECRGITLLFTALCRAAGVPARPVWGVLFIGKDYDSHNWAEVYIADVGWVPIDPQMPETFGWLPIDRVRMFMDLKKSDKTEENLPLLNLLFMNGEKKLQFEQSR